MSKKKRRYEKSAPETVGLKLSKPAAGQSDNLVSQSDKTGWFSYLKSHWRVAGIIALLSLGALGAGLKYLEEDAGRQVRNSYLKQPQKEQSFLNKINPFLPDPTPTPTPQLSKEYIYAGGRLLAVEDANANAAPPADLAVWRPSTGVWWVMGSAGSQQVTQAWGISGDVPVPGDYDGDGKTDFSVFRPSNGTWYIVNSSTGGTGQFAFGQSDDKAAQADYDGDGRTDAAVFRPSTGTWYILQSSNNQTAQGQFGLSTDTPAPADYDGDGRADIAVWRASNTTFYSSNSSNNQLSTATFSSSSSEPLSADYDGDGRADYAIRNSADWIIRNSSSGQMSTVSWQSATDTAVPNDYDGDGKVDVAVWRDSNGNWYIRKSGAGGALRQEQWGMAGDIPVPAFYRR